MNDPKLLPITPETKVGELLSHYPALEETLIALSPEFRRLKNPVLRATVAKMATLGQVARIGGVAVAEVVSRLRAAAGENDAAASADVPEGCPGPGEAVGASALDGAAPSWFDRGRIASTLDARAMIEEGKHPLPDVVRAAQGLAAEQILELITPFEPAPLIDVLRGQGFEAWGERRGAREVRTYLLRAKQSTD